MSVQPQPGDFGCVKTAGPLLDRLAAWAIRFGTNSPVNHAFVYIGQGQIVEAVRRVKVDFADQYDDVTWSTGRLPASLTPTPAQRNAIVQAALAMVDDRYNLLDIVAIALAQKRLGRRVDGDEWWVKRLSANGREICSQVVDKAYDEAGIHLFRNRLEGLVSPGDLYDLLLPVTVGR